MCNILLRASEEGSPINRFGSVPRRDMDQGPFSQSQGVRKTVGLLNGVPVSQHC